MGDRVARFFYVIAWLMLLCVLAVAVWNLPAFWYLAGRFHGNYARCVDAAPDSITLGNLAATRARCLSWAADVTR